MKYLYSFVFILFSTAISAQVGIGTTSPNAQLDIRSSNQTTPSNTDGLLIPKIDEFPATSPGAGQDGMLVYVTGSGTPTKGFYYWNNGSTSWLLFQGSSEWTDNGSYMSPSDGNNEDVTIGGTDNANSKLTVKSTKPIIGLFSNNGTQDNFMYGVNTYLTNNSTASGSYTIGNYNDIINTGAGLTFGDYNRVRGDGSSIHFGNYNLLSGNGTGNHHGISNTLMGSGTGDQIGVSSTISNSGDAFHTGTLNVLTGSGSGTHTAVHNNISGVGTGRQIGTENIITNSSNGAHTTLKNRISNDGNGIHIGSQNEITGNGNGLKYSTSNYLDGAGSGQKYGSYNYINSTAGGLHFGVYSNVLKPGSYAGYFIGQVAIGTTSGNTYLLPASRGTNGQVLQTDGLGNVNWVNNTSFGIQEINDLTDGKSDNDGSQDGSSVFLGSLAGFNDDSSDNKNIGIGFNALYSNTTGQNNVGVGYQASVSNTTGSFNTVIGNQSFSSNTTGSWNTATGHTTLASNTTGNSNVAYGFYSLYSNTSGIRNIAIGNSALTTNTSGSENTSVGHESLYFNTIGDDNTALGYQALRNNTEGEDNVAVGYYSLSNNTTGADNVALGKNALLSNTIGNGNSSLGFLSLENNTTGGLNSVVGNGALSNNTTGSWNTVMGSVALELNTTGSFNLALGFRSGDNLLSGDSNIIIGGGIDFPNATDSNQLNIGNLIYGTNVDGSNNTLSTGNIGIGIQAPLDKLDVGGKIRISTSVSNAAQLKNDDTYNHFSDANLDFGDDFTAWMLSSLEGADENSGIYGDRDFVTIWAPADSGRMIRFLDEDNWADNDGNPYNNNAELAYVDNAGQFVQASDENRKQSIEIIPNALEKIKQIHGYTYEYKLSQSEKQKGQVPKKTSGVIAQELYEVLPEAVQVSENEEYFVHYAGIIPLLLEGLKEQQKIIENQQKEIQELKKLEERIKKIESSLENR